MPDKVSARPDGVGAKLVADHARPYHPVVYARFLTGCCNEMPEVPAREYCHGELL
jgi:hypothetical protein